MNMVDLPLITRVIICLVAIVNFCLSWLTENYFVPLFVKLIAQIENSIRIRNSSVDLAANPNAVKMIKWTQSGKRFKIVQEQFR
jgi:hypothetical protein